MFPYSHDPTNSGIHFFGTPIEISCACWVGIGSPVGAGTLGRVHVGAAFFTAGRGGIARVARNSARALIEDGTNVSLLGLLDENPVSICGYSTQLARSSRLRFVFECHRAALTHDTFLYDFLGTARAHPRFVGLRRPYILWIHGIEIWGELSMERQRVLRGAELVLANSAYTLNRFHERHGILTQAEVCRLGTEEDNPVDAPATFHCPPTALMVARMDEGDIYKGHKELIEAWPCVVSAVPDARLVIVGGGNAKHKVVAHAARSPVAENIEVRGFLSEGELAETWREAHVFAMPSRGEGFGLVYIEAMRHGLPVIASVHDAGQEVNVDGETGRNVDLDRPGALEDSLIELLSDTDLAKRMGDAGRQRWLGEFRYSAFKERFLKALS